MLVVVWNEGRGQVVAKGYNLSISGLQGHSLVGLCDEISHLMVVKAVEKVLWFS